MDLIAEGQVDDLTRLVLASAIYFKGQWAEPFPEEGTKEAPFRLASGKTVQVPTMHRTESFRSMEGETLRAVEIPYLGGDLSMIVLVPKDANGLPALEKALDAQRLREWLSSLEPSQLSLALPKFRFSSRLELPKTLQALGMKDAFDARRADFSAMTGGPDLYIGFVVHEAFIGVDEKGTEAAAATAVGMKLLGLPPKPTPFRVDRPFLFVIRENRTGCILFLGRVLDPRSKGG